MTIIPEPEVLSRIDLEHGRWEIDTCAPKRGLPHTIISARKMVTPADDSEMSRAIRAHEMMHAKVSPDDQWKQWVERGIATNEALTVCEEARVNLLCQKAGFDMLNHLSDDGETADGERIAMMGDWHSAVMFAVATAGTASAKKYLNGIRRHRREWGPHLKNIQKRVLDHYKQILKDGTEELASTAIDEKSGLSPVGFRHVEAIGEWVDRIAGLQPEEPKDEKSDDDTDEKSKPEPKADGPVKSESKLSSDELGSLIKHEPVAPSSSYVIPTWGELKIGRLPLEIVSTGTMGKKRVSTNVGRHPRRMTRYMTDPEMRLFDRKVRAKGGIVVIDNSGSMGFSREQIRQIVEMAPGATVLAYTWLGESEDNAWILAQNGKMYRELDVRPSGNGVDLPALEWAMKNRRHNEPVIWVSDGGVSGTGDTFDESLTRQCAKFVQKHRILCAPNTASAVEMLKKLAKGEKPRSSVPLFMRRFLAG